MDLLVMEDVFLTAMLVRDVVLGVRYLATMSMGRAIWMRLSTNFPALCAMMNLTATLTVHARLTLRAVNSADSALVSKLNNVRVPGSNYTTFSTMFLVLDTLFMTKMRH